MSFTMMNNLRGLLAGFNISMKRYSRNMLSVFCDNAYSRLHSPQDRYIVLKITCDTFYFTCAIMSYSINTNALTVMIIIDHPLFPEEICGRISSMPEMRNGMIGSPEMDLQGIIDLYIPLKRILIHVQCRLAEESIRLQELVGAINRGTITTEGFKELRLPFTDKLPADEVSAPKEGGVGRRGSLMPMAIKFGWNSLPVPRQQQFISQVLSVWSKLEKTLVGKAIIRVWRDESDRERAAYIQFIQTRR